VDRRSGKVPLTELQITMMNDMMGGGMMWGMGLVSLLVIIVLVLGVAALIKYLVSGR
jgi:hypothetical protein